MTDVIDAVVNILVNVVPWDTRTAVDEVYIAEVSVVVLAAVVVATVLRVEGAGSAGLLVGITVGADDERVAVVVVEPIVTALAYTMLQAENMSLNMCKRP